METLGEKLKACTVLVLNGETYFGKVEKTDGGVEITDAVEVTEKGNFKKVVKDWLKANNSGKLESLEVTGMTTLAKKPLSEEQKMKIDSIAAEAAYIVKHTLTDMQNKKIDEI